LVDLVPVGLVPDSPKGTPPPPAPAPRIESVHESLSSPFVKTSISYSVTITCADITAARLHDAAVAAFQPNTVVVLRVSDDVSVDLRITDVTVQHKKFMIVKAQTTTGNISFKVYFSSLLQLFGLKDTQVAPAESYAAALIAWVVDSLNYHSRLTIVAEPPDILAMSAFHVAVSECGYRFDTDALESILGTAFPTAKVKRNTSNNSVLLNHTKTSGTQIFHSTGTTQLMGVRSEPDEYLAALRLLIAANPHVLIPQDKKRKRRKNMITGSSFVPREVPTKTMRTADNLAVESVSPLSEAQTATPPPPAPSVDCLLDELLETPQLCEELCAELNVAQDFDAQDFDAMDFEAKAEATSWLDEAKADATPWLDELELLIS